MSSNQDVVESKDNLNSEDSLNALRKKYVLADNIWKLSSLVILLSAFVYIILVFRRFLDVDFYINAIVALVLLIALFFCIYLLPHLLKTSSKQKTYFSKYKEAYLKPTLEEAFSNGDYTDYEKVTSRDLTKITILKKAKGAVANDCIRGKYKNIEFSRYDLALRYGKKKSSSDCVLIITELKTKLKSEVQIVQNDFKIGGMDYEQPETFCKILSTDEKFDEEFAVYAKDQEEGQKFVDKEWVRKLKNLKLGGPFAVFCDKGEICVIIKKKKDTMEAPIHTPVKAKKAIKDANDEVECIKTWIEIVDDCL